MKVVIITVTNWQKGWAKSTEEAHLLNWRLIVERKDLGFHLPRRIARRKKHLILNHFPTKPIPQLLLASPVFKTGFQFDTLIIFSA